MASSDIVYLLLWLAMKLGICRGTEIETVRMHSQKEIVPSQHLHEDS